MIKAVVLWVMTPCSVVTGASNFNPKMGSALSSEVTVFYHITTRHHNPQDHNSNIIPAPKS